MKLTLSAPSKTFLVGEYAVLSKGPALVINTGPRFELRVERGDTDIRGLPAGCPAMRWIEARRPLLNNWRVEFYDPHDGQGGLGASGAQFLLVHTLTTFLQSSFEKTVTEFDLQAVWNDYQVLSGSEGSGADILAQATGQVTELEMGTLTARPVAWPYPELSWSIVRTHRKVATHEHLRALDREAMSLLAPPAVDCVHAFGRAASEVFVGHLKVFSQRLRESGLQAPSTGALVNLLEKEDWCLLAKGCGALGADTVLVLYATTERDRVATFLRKQHLQILATLNDLSPGLEWSCQR